MNPPDEENKVTLGGQNKVSVATLLVVVIASLGAGAWAWRMETLVERSLGEQWTQTQQKVWALRLQGMNPGLHVPEVEDKPKVAGTAAKDTSNRP